MIDVAKGKLGCCWKSQILKVRFFIRGFQKRGHDMMESGVGHDGEWDDNDWGDAPKKEANIVDNKWVMLMILPAQFVMYLVLIFMGILLCAFVVSPIFVVWKVGGNFLGEVGKVREAFARDWSKN
jgi:hypothetical protein